MIGDNTAPTGLVFELLFDNVPLKDSSRIANPLTITGSAQRLRQSKGAFDGKTWITLPKSDAFDCSNVAWRVEAEIIPDEMNGVIMSQGGLRHGYSLFLKDGKPGFAVRLDGEAYSIVGTKRIEGTTLLSGTITPNKQLVLQVNGETVAERSIPDLIFDMPADPPIIGNDLAGAVVEPALPAFKGRMKRVAVFRGGLPTAETPVAGKQ
jgi:hypothetical protein